MPPDTETLAAPVASPFSKTLVCEVSTNNGAAMGAMLVSNA